MNRRELLMELSLLGAFCLVLLWLMTEADLYERFHAFSRLHEDWELDEIVLLAPAFALAACIFAFRRLMDMRRETQLRMDAEQQAQTERELRQHQERYQALVDNALEGIVVLQNNKVVYANPLIHSALRREMGSLLDRIYTDFIHPEDKDKAEQAYQRAMDAEGSPQMIRVLQSDGQARWFQSRATLILWEEQRSLLVFLSDETDRVLAEEKTERMRLFLDDIINSMPSVVIGVDAEIRVTLWNNAARLATGITSSLAQGRPLTEVFPRLSGDMNLVRVALETKTIQAAHKRPYTGGDTTRYEDVVAYPLQGTGMDGAVIRVDDTSHEVRMEEALLQSEKMRSVCGLAAGAAHELNNPLGIILQGLQNTKRRMNPDFEPNRKKAEELGLDIELMDTFLHERGIPAYLDAISAAGKRASSIVSSLLDFTTNRDARRNAATQVNDLVDGTLGIAASDTCPWKGQRHLHDMEIVKEYGVNLPAVRGSRSELEQVVLNLLCNAVQALSDAPGQNAPRIILRTALDTDGMIRIEVEDNGPGMDEDTRLSALNPFFTTRKPGAGIGLGLALCHLVVAENHGGELRLESVPGHGTRAIVRLPAF